MAIPIQAGELDSGSFILRQGGVDVCWMHSSKISGNGSERWYWKAGFGTPVNMGDEVQWSIRRDTYGAGQLDAWKAARAPLATTHKVHSVSNDVL